MSNAPPDFLALSSIEEDFLTGRLEAARKLITHSGEKGRSLEAEVMALLRSFLPNEYGLSTGFIVYQSGAEQRISSQLDIIIYDSIRSGPIARLSTCDVFPLEAVYGYIEVKSSLQSTSDKARKAAENSIERCLQINKELRAMTERRFWSPVPGSPIKECLQSLIWLGIRSYVFAFAPQGKIARAPDKMAQRLADATKREGNPVHLHGVFVAGSAYYSTCAVDKAVAKPDEFHHVHYTTSHPLAAFKWSLLSDLARFPRTPEGWTPAVDQYRGKSDWRTCAPAT